MIINYKSIGVATLGILFFSACQQKEDEVQEVISEEISSMPMQNLELNDMEGFQPVSENWSIAGGVQSDYKTDNSMEVLEGAGVLVNVPTDGQHNHIFTHLEHGDIELKLEFLVPKSNN